MQCKHPSIQRSNVAIVLQFRASEGLHTVKVLDTFPIEILKKTTGFPTKVLLIHISYARISLTFNKPNQPIAVLCMLISQFMFVSQKWGSDHIALACELAFTK
jgi:hypothetical protein